MLFRFGERFDDRIVQISPFDRRLEDVGRIYQNGQSWIVLRLVTSAATHYFARPMHTAVPRLRRVFPVEQDHRAESTPAIWAGVRR